jgi:hypothetical protein
MHRMARDFIVAIFLSSMTVELSGVALAQSQTVDSLGEVARANRANKQAQEASGTAPKVITNKDLPPGSTSVPQSSTLDTMTTVSGVQKADRFGDPQLSNRFLAQQHTSAEWKARIQAQENQIADLQARIDHVAEWMHAAVGTVEYATPVNRYQAVQSERLARMQDMLDQQKRRLAFMQDAARHAGMNQ